MGGIFEFVGHGGAVEIASEGDVLDSHFIHEVVDLLELVGESALFVHSAVGSNIADEEIAADEAV